MSPNPFLHKMFSAWTLKTADSNEENAGMKGKLNMTSSKHMYIIGLKQSSVAYEFFTYGEETFKEWISVL